MAKPTNKLSNTSDKISISTYGIGDKLDKESATLSKVLRQDSLEIQTRFGKSNDLDTIVDSATQLTISSIFNTKKKDNIISEDKYRKLLTDENNNASQLLANESSRLISYSNYTSINENIPECGLASTTFVSTILSPDDSTNKTILATYDDPENEVLKNLMNKRLKKIIDQYHLNQKIKDYVNDSVVLGDCFVAVLPYDREISKFLSSQSNNGVLNEDLITSVKDNKILSLLNEEYHLDSRVNNKNCIQINEDFVSGFANDEEKEVLNEAFGESYAKSFSTFINEGIVIKPVTDYLIERTLADNDEIYDNTNIVFGTNEKKSKLNNSMNNKTKSLNLNGSFIKKLDPSRTVELEIDNVVYGTYVVEPGTQCINGLIGQSINSTSAIQVDSPANPQIMRNRMDDPNSNGSSQSAINLGISDEKISILANVILKAIGKKLNKSYIEKNKGMKTLIYSLLHQKEVLQKGLQVSFFMPDEVVHYKMDSIFSKIVFYAKIYLATLTNIILIKMGRGNDTRLITVKAGLDNNYAQTITKIIENLKTREFKMSNLGSINSVLALDPGAFHDIILPEDANGNTPVHIDTLQGMNQDINNEFMTFLRDSMITGTGLPPAISDASNNIDFAKQIATQNINFCKIIENDQTILEEPTTKLIRLLFRNEYKYNLDNDNNLDSVDLTKIEFHFPVPRVLKLANVLEQFNEVDSTAEYIAKTYVPEKTTDPTNIDKMAAFKAVIVKDMLPQLDWNKYDSLYKDFEINYTKSTMTTTSKNKRRQPDPNDGMGY